MFISILIKGLLLYLVVIFFRTLYNGYKAFQLHESMQDDGGKTGHKRSEGGEDVVEAEYRVLDDEESDS